MSSTTFYAWKAKYGGMDVSEAKWLKALEEENAKLKRFCSCLFCCIPGIVQRLESLPHRESFFRASPIAEMNLSQGLLL